jgi:hypothetical protein
MPQATYFIITAQEFGRRLVTGSQEQSYDYAIFKYPEAVRDGDHQFCLVGPNTRRIGDPIALLGFPLEHDNLTCHQGVISSFYDSGVAKVIQLDASVNAGNSGGPLIDPDSGDAFGIVTRKATGLSKLFEELRESVRKNLEAANSAGGGISIGGIDPKKVFIASQNQMLHTFNEIERQANVGIGYAFSAEHVLAEPCMQE